MDAREWKEGFEQWARDGFPVGELTIKDRTIQVRELLDTTRQPIPVNEPMPSETATAISTYLAEHGHGEEARKLTDGSRVTFGMAVEELRPLFQEQPV